MIEKIFNMNFVQNLLSILLVSSQIIPLTSCKGEIKPENKIAIIAKIVNYPMAAKNGAKDFVYFYLGKKHVNFSSFDGRYFTHGDKFVLHIDRNNPRHWEIIRPLVKFKGLMSFKQDAHTKYYLNENDLRLLDSIPLR
jgi:hypothetical protein